MEFLVHSEVPLSAAGIQRHIRIDNLPDWCASIDRLLSHDGERGSIYCLWGEFRVHREVIRDGVRFTLPGCPNALQWTVTAVDAGHGPSVSVHLTINRSHHEEDFIESIEQFLADWQSGLEQGVKRLHADEDRGEPDEGDCAPWYG
ncbi:hypothetical protein QVG61_12315 [Thiohalobacter sp. IOR34]|uniref:hypothetical protein n=1 Tax=Thiohalobacter sp. IOR34 TaxID=3057176 RepID=UPI0025B13C1D|nr:hypothetical protein [Thiohalobacter sp. IOR34]WJW75257.1 hypothetical protein QVG61_12315 [Thiohalobacter sp. IOR34]